MEIIPIFFRGYLTFRNAKWVTIKKTFWHRIPCRLLLNYIWSGSKQSHLIHIVIFNNNFRTGSSTSISSVWWHQGDVWWIILRGTHIVFYWHHIIIFIKVNIIQVGSIRKCSPALIFWFVNKPTPKPAKVILS